MFRRHWLVDLTYFFINSLLIEVLTVLTLTPALILFDWARIPAVSQIVASLPLVVQVPLVMLVADFTQYWVHRSFHAVPLLWPFHAISVEQMDWLAGSRLHLVDVILTRPLSTTGITAPTLRPWTRTFRCIPRFGTSCSAPTTCQTPGRRDTG